MQALLRNVTSAVTDSVDAASGKARISADAATESVRQTARDAMEEARTQAANAAQMTVAAAESAGAAVELTADAVNTVAHLAKDVAEDGFTTTEEQVSAYVASRPKPAGPFAAYIRLGDLAYTLAICAPFEFTVYFFITVSCLYAGASTYVEIASASWMATLDIVLAVVFLTETAVKLVAEGTRPWKFFYGNPYWGWNCFDFTSTPPARADHHLHVHQSTVRSTTLLF